MANLYSAYSSVFENNARIRVYYTYSQNQANNTTTVYGSAYYESDSPDGAVSQYSLKIRIYLGGQTIYLETANQTIPYYNNGGRLVGNFSKTFTHNSDGTIGAISIQGYGTNIGEYTNTAYVYPPSFARYSYFTQLYVVSTSLTQATIHWEADSVVGYADYNINGGSPIWASGPEFTVSNLAPGTTYTIKVNIQRLDSGLWTSQNINVTTKDIARLTGGNNISDEQNPYMIFSNPSGAALTAYMQTLNPSSTFVVKENIPNTGNYTFVLTQAEKDIIYAKCQNLNSTTIRYGIATKVNGVDTYWNSIDRTVTMVNANPIFSNFTYEDVNVETKLLTGNNQKIIKGYSILNAIISNSNKAIAQKSATMSKYTLITGSKAGVDVAYSDTNDVNMTINNADGNVASVYAIDSRNNSTKKDIPVSLIEYSPIKIQSINIERGTGGIGTESTLNFTGDIWNSSFGDVSNSIVSATYKYKKTTDTEYIDGTTNITPIVTNNTYSESTIIAGDLGASGFNSAYSYNIQVTITDKLSSITQNIVLQSGKPQLAFGIGQGVAIGSFYDPEVGGSFQIEGKLIENIIYPVGFIYQNLTDSTNPSLKFGGTWVQLTDRFLIGAGATYANGSTGGASKVTLTIDHVPSHNHSFGSWIGWYASGGVQGIIGNGTGAGYTTYTGGGQAHENMPPYRAVYQWYRSV